ncbi:E3 ubiquitin- ligase UHRF1-like, partial [Paramuricea clavata]
GRDLKGTKSNPKNLRTAPQSKDQTLTKGNLALSKNVENRKPVRVVRGYKLNSPYAPAEGYRYDGLYTVEKYWKAIGFSGFVVYKFALKRCSEQAPSPWLDELQ